MDVEKPAGFEGRASVVGCLAWLAFGGAWAILFLVVSIGAGYGSSDPLLLVYAAVLIVGAVPVGVSVSERPAAGYAAGYAVLVGITLILGSTYG